MRVPLMEIISTINAATTDVQHSSAGDGATYEAALLLIAEAASQLTADPEWSALALTTLSVSEQLYPDPAPILLDLRPAAADTRELRAAVAGLLAALADGYDLASGNGELPASRALAFGAAAVTLRQRAALLT